VSDPGLDRTFLDELLDGDREFAAELVATFEQAARQWLGTARRACAASQAQEAVRAFHTLKGSAGSVGLPELRELARMCEALARDGDLESSGDLVAMLELRVEEGLRLLEAYLESLST
jgi:HPt (histidine-containing phosphotransfer) domain-containing protein